MTRGDLSDRFVVSVGEEPAVVPPQSHCDTRRDMGFDITSAANERLKRVVRLRDKRHRDNEGLFVVEGPRLATRALGAGHVPVEVFLDGSCSFESPTKALTVEPSTLDRVSYRDRSEGLIAVFKQFDTGIGNIGLGENPLVLIAEAIEKPGNLGSMLRLADAVGADGFISVSGVTDLFNPNVVRSSTGALFTVSIAVCELEELVSWVRFGPMRLAAAAPDSEEILWDIDLTGPTSLMVGAEDAGLTPDALSVADVQFSIPMEGGSDSLNTSMALGLSAFEAIRQRRARSG